MHFIEELKRRSVFKVGWMYMVVSWVTTQMGGIALPAFGAPDWMLRSLLGLVVLGFPVALVFAWAYDLTPEGLKRENHEPATKQEKKRGTLDFVIMSVLVLALVYFIWESRFSKSDITEQPESAVVEQTTPNIPEPIDDQFINKPPEKTTVAVLPFSNRSNRPEDQFFTDGIHDDILTRLAKIRSFRVISRASVGKYRDSEKTLPEIAAELGAQNIIQGGIQRAGEQVRINVQLIDAATDTALWAESFDRSLSAENLFSVQSEIATDIATALQATLSEDEQARIAEVPTTNTQAYYAYLNSRQLQSRLTAESLQQALDGYLHASELDPEFALAWVGIAETNQLLVSYGSLAMETGDQLAYDAAQKALALNPRLGEAYAVLGYYYEVFQQMPRADEAYRLAIDLSPSAASIYQRYSAFLSQSPDRLEESLSLIRIAAQLDPLSPTVQVAIGNRLKAIGKFEEAAAQYQRLMAIDPGFAPAYYFMGILQMEALGRFDLALEWLEKARELDPGNIRQIDAMGQVYTNLMELDRTENMIVEIRAIEAGHWAASRLEAQLGFIRGDTGSISDETKQSLIALKEYPEFQFMIGLIHIAAGNLPSALEFMTGAYPGYLQRDQWRFLIQEHDSDACLVGWLFLQNGQQQMGRDLLQQTIQFLEHDLPNYMQNSERYSIATCFEANGQTEKALDALQLQVDRGFINNWWWMRLSSIFETLHDQPRFKEILNQIEREVESQRNKLAARLNE